MPYEEHEQQSGDQKNQAVTQHLVLRFKVWIDGTQQADSPTPSSQCNENIGELVSGRVMFLRFDNCDQLLRLVVNIGC